MLETAIKAGIPMIRVTCTDPLHMEQVLEDLTGQEDVPQWKTITKVGLYKPGTPKVGWCDQEALINSDTFQVLKSSGKVCVFVNAKPNTLLFDAGPLLPSPQLIAEKVAELGGDSALALVCKGMTLKQVEDLLLLSSARYGNLHPKNVRSMRISLGQTVQGLYPIETDLGYYEPMKDLDEWLKVNAPYFIAENVPEVLVPRGLLFDGPPGTGKTMAARYIAHHLQLPLYRLDVSTTLNRFLGESEARLAQSLQLLEREAPCVVLFDEVEKVFSSDADDGVIDRMLSQLLWWLQEHRARVFTVMTSNDKSKIPAPLIRPGRIDHVFEVPAMTAKEATRFAHRLLGNVMAPKKATLAQLHHFSFTDVAGTGGGFSHAQVAATVYETIKTKGWLSIDKPST